MSAEIADQSPHLKDTGVYPRPLTRTEYYRLADLGLFENERVELIEGAIYRKWTGELFHWKRENYHRAAEDVFSPTERLELILGKVFKKVTQSALHTMSLRATSETLTLTFGSGFDVRQQLPLVLFDDGEPEPDVLVVPGSWRDYPQQPTQERALLLVEISDTTLYYDRREKAALYAQAGISDYWIVNLQNRTLEVRRTPAPLPNSPYGFGYLNLTVLITEDNITPLVLPTTRISVADLLPPV